MTHMLISEILADPPKNLERELGWWIAHSWFTSGLEPTVVVKGHQLRDVLGVDAKSTLVVLPLLEPQGEGDESPSTRRLVALEVKDPPTPTGQAALIELGQVVPHNAPAESCGNAAPVILAAAPGGRHYHEVVAPNPATGFRVDGEPLAQAIGTSAMRSWETLFSQASVSRSIPIVGERSWNPLPARIPLMPSDASVPSKKWLTHPKWWVLYNEVKVDYEDNGDAIDVLVTLPPGDPEPDCYLAWLADHVALAISDSRARFVTVRIGYAGSDHTVSSGVFTFCQPPLLDAIRWVA